MGTTYETAFKPLKAIAHDVGGTNQAADLDYIARTKTLTFPLMIVDVINTSQENFLWVADKDVTVVSAVIIPGVAQTAHNTNYKTLTLKVEDASATAVHTIAALTTQISGTGNWAAGVPEPFTVVVDTNDTIPEGNILSLVIASSGAGIVIGPYCLQLVVRYD